ncbi:MAG: hypothetical protein ACLFS0_02405 [Bacteroidales bacterium]
MQRNLHSVLKAFSSSLARGKAFPFICLFAFITLQGFATQDPAGKECSFRKDDRGQLRASYLSDLPDQLTYLKIDQGFSKGLLFDQKMSNLYYDGPGGILSFAIHRRSATHISEWHLARATFQYSRPHHESTLLYNFSGGTRFVYLRRLEPRGAFRFYGGGQVDLTSDFRVIPAMGNSSLFANAMGSLQPRVDISYALLMFDREWNFDFSLAASLIGYNMGFPDYGSSYRIGDDGGISLQNFESFLTHPGNTAQISSGIFYRHSFGNEYNPNWCRIGYNWDYLRVNGNHDLRLYNVRHQLVLELYFLLN